MWRNTKPPCRENEIETREGEKRLQGIVKTCVLCVGSLTKKAILIICYTTHSNYTKFEVCHCALRQNKTLCNVIMTKSKIDLRVNIESNEPELT